MPYLHVCWTLRIPLQGLKQRLEPRLAAQQEIFFPRAAHSNHHDRPRPGYSSAGDDHESPLAASSNSSDYHKRVRVWTADTELYWDLSHAQGQPLGPVQGEEEGGQEEPRQAFMVYAAQLQHRVPCWG